MDLLGRLKQDIRYEEGLKACINCGICTSICPAASCYDYDPRQIVDTVQKADEARLEELLSGEEIWMCGECMSCKTRCPRQNVPGLLIMALRSLAQDSGLFVRSQRGRQQLVVKRTVGDNILKYGYCLYPIEITPELHPEQGKIWEWWYRNSEAVYQLFDHEYLKDGPGIFKRLPPETLHELEAIFEVTGARARFDFIEREMEKFSAENLDGKEGPQLFMAIYRSEY